MNNNTTTTQEIQYTLEQAINIVKSNVSSIWRTEDVLNLLTRIREEKHEVDMSDVIEAQQQLQGIYHLFEDIDTSIEAVESSIDNIDVDESNIELSFYGREVQVDNINIDGQRQALSDLHGLRQEINYLKEKIQDFAGKEDVK